jgi:putative heme-binding domain-containing protein
MGRKSGLPCIVLFGWMLGLAAHAQTLPPGTGRADFQRICSGCHSTDRASSQRMTRAEWAGVVSDMVGRGAQGTSAELDNVISYLSANFGKSNALAAVIASPHTAPPAPPAAVQQAPLSQEQIARARSLIQVNGCLSCHRVDDAGSYLGPSLDGIGAQRSPEQLRTSLLSPKKEVLAENRTAQLITGDGKTVTGRLLNQDGFSVQLIEASGQLASFAKSGLREFTIVTTNPMLSYADKLSAQQLTELVQYLSSLKGASPQ